MVWCVLENHWGLGFCSTPGARPTSDLGYEDMMDMPRQLDPNGASMPLLPLPSLSLVMFSATLCNLPIGPRQTERHIARHRPPQNGCPGRNASQHRGSQAESCDSREQLVT